MSSIKTIYRVARSRDELEQGFSLVYKEYQRRGYIPKGYRSRLRLSLYNALPTSTTFVAMQGNRVVASVTLIPDSQLGVPMDKLYKAEVDKYRKAGRKIAEVSQLSIDTKLFGNGFFSMFNFNKLIFIFKLFKLVLEYARDVESIKDICIAVNPKQQYLYKFLMFDEIGPLRYYGFVNKAPAVALRLNLEEAEDRIGKRQGLDKIFFKLKSDPKLFEHKFKISVKDLKYFFVDKSDLFKKAEKEQIGAIRSYYPEKEFDMLLDSF